MKRAPQLTTGYSGSFSVHIETHVKSSKYIALFIDLTQMKTIHKRSTP